MRIPFVSRAYGAVARILASAAGAVRWVGNRTRDAWRTLRATPWTVLRARLLLGLVVVMMSVFWGYATAIFELNALYIVVGLVLSVFILFDFRVGALLLIIIIPISGSKFFPHQLLGITGLNPTNLLLGATLFAYAVRRALSPSNHRFFPKELVWLFLAPIFVAALLGSTHVQEIPGFLLNGEAPLSYTNATGYLRDVFVRPMFVVLFALILAAAVAETKDIRRYLITGVISVWVMILLVLFYFLTSGLSLGEVGSDSQRSFFSPMGFHANQLGRLYAIIFALFIFSAAAYRHKAAKIFIWLSAGMAGFAAILSFSRGGFLVLLVIGLLYLYSLRRKNLLPVLALALPLLLLALPGAFYKRIAYGFDQGADLNTISSSRTEEIWAPLIPEIFDSPLIGHGLSSMVWSKAMISRAVIPVTHPHNAYLELLLDVGFVGTALILLFYWRIWKRFRALAQNQDIDPGLRGLFTGASVALVGFSVGGISGSSFEPIIEQVYLWFAIGLAYGVTSRMEMRERQYG